MKRSRGAPQQDPRPKSLVENIIIEAKKKNGLKRKANELTNASANVKTRSQIAKKSSTSYTSHN